MKGYCLGGSVGGAQRRAAVGNVAVEAPGPELLLAPNAFKRLVYADDVVDDKPAFDVFLSHAHEDAEWVEDLATKLEDQHGFQVWLDKWILVPGEHWQQEISKGLDLAATCAVVLGETTPDGWFREEVERALNRQTAEPSFRVIPVLLPDSSEEVVKGFLALRTWADFRAGKDREYALHLLACGIKGIPVGRWPPEQEAQDARRNLDWYMKRLAELKRLSVHVEHGEAVLEMEKKILAVWYKESVGE